MSMNVLNSNLASAEQIGQIRDWVKRLLWHSAPPTRFELHEHKRGLAFILANAGIPVDDDRLSRDPISGVLREPKYNILVLDTRRHRDLEDDSPTLQQIDIYRNRMPDATPTAAEAQLPLRFGEDYARKLGFIPNLFERPEHGEITELGATMAGLLLHDLRMFESFEGRPINCSKQPS